MNILGRCANTPIRERIGLPLAFLFLLGAVVVGLDMITRPKRHLRGYLGGEMLHELKETERQILGVIIVVGACWAIYQFMVEVWISCFSGVLGT